MYRYRRPLLPWLIVFAAALLIGLGAGVAVGRYYLPNTASWDLALQEARAGNAALIEQAEGEYYRGIYDMWRFFSKSSGVPVDAMGMTGEAVERGWYGQTSFGWHWPID